MFIISSFSFNLKFFKYLYSFVVFVFTILCFMSFENGCSALPIGMHYYIGEKVLQKLLASSLEKSLTSGKNAESFLFGNVDADRGRLGLDSVTGKATDGKEFVDKLLSLAETEEEKWYALGFKTHMLVDQQTESFLGDIFGKSEVSYIYLKWYGILDNYFMLKKLGYIDIDSLKEFDLDEVFEFLPKNIKKFRYRMKKWFLKQLIFVFGDVKGLLKYFCKNFKSSYYVLPKHEDLLKKVYKQVLNYNVSNKELEKNIANLVGASMLLCLKERDFVFDDDFVKKVDERVEELADFVIKKLTKEGVFIFPKNK